ncbi:MAG: DUF4242 domain-containing protein [Chloroflexi bacterium]|nr:DUF4242 domain-containing protein [Chloroflexota bacterium]
MSFIGVHERQTRITEAQLRRNLARLNDFGKDLGVKFLRLYYSPGENRILCTGEAPNKKAIEDVHAKLGLRCDDIWDVSTIE